MLLFKLWGRRILFLCSLRGWGFWLPKQQSETNAKLDFNKVSEFRLKLVSLFFKEPYSFVCGVDCTFVRNRLASEGPQKFDVAVICLLRRRITIRFCRYLMMASPCILMGYGFILSSYRAMSRASILSVLTVVSTALPKFFIFSGFSILTVIPATLNIYSSKALLFPVAFMTQWILPSWGRVPMNFFIPVVVLSKVWICSPLSKE